MLLTRRRGPCDINRLLALLTLVLAGCGGGGGDDMVEPEAEPGAIRVTTSTSGDEIDPDGYTVSVGSSSESIGVNDNVTFADLAEDDHSVELGGVVLNCAVDGQNPRTVIVREGETAETTFEVGCLPTGSLQVTAQTTGEDLDRDGYQVTARGAARFLAANGNATVDGLPEGPVGVELGFVASNCEVEGSNPRTVTIAAGATVETTFRVSCSPMIWATKADMETARLGLATAAVDGQVYAIGGYQQANAPGLQTVEAYDPVTDTWTAKAPMPTGRRWLTAAAVNGKIYAIGGHVSAGEAGLATVEEYDPASNTWARKSPMPTSRYAISSSVLDGRIYVVGGTPDGNTVIGTLEEYDPATDTWATKADMSTNRALVAFEAVGRKLYAIGGGPNPASGLSTVEVYDPASDAWTTRNGVPTPRSSVCGSVVDGIIYVIGGADGGMGGAIYARTEAYDPASGTWAAKPDMPTPRAALACAALNGRIYATGGTLDWTIPHPGVQTVEKFDPNAP